MYTLTQYEETLVFGGNSQRSMIFVDNDFGGQIEELLSKFSSSGGSGSGSGGGGSSGGGSGGGGGGSW